jgi:hypothetical protein
MVGYNTVQGVGCQRFLLTTIEAQFLMNKLCLARMFHELLLRDRRTFRSVASKEGYL